MVPTDTMNERHGPARSPERAGPWRVTHGVIAAPTRRTLRSVLDDPGAENVDIVAQAMGMVSVQADCSVEDAFEMMTDRATVEHSSVITIATYVVDGVIRFGP